MRPAGAAAACVLPLAPALHTIQPPLGLITWPVI